MGLVVVVIVTLLLLGGLPTWGYHSYGYAPSGMLGIILIVVLVWLLLGHRF